MNTINLQGSPRVKHQLVGTMRPKVVLKGYLRMPTLTKLEQRKTLNATENGSYEVLPDENRTLSGVSVNVDVPIPEGYIDPEGTAIIASNGIHDITHYEFAEVNIPERKEEQEKAVEITENGTTEILPDGDKVLSKATVNVNVPIPDGYIKPEGSMDITENGTFDVREKAEVNVNVSISADTSMEDGLITRSITEYHNDRVTTIGTYAFASNQTIESVSFPNVVEFTGSNNFTSCNNLKSIYFPKLKTAGGGNAFRNCSSLIEVTLPEIYVSPSFQACSSLRKLDLGTTNQVFAQYPFNDMSFPLISGCSTLECVIIRPVGKLTRLSNVNHLSNSAIANGTGYIYVPKALIEEYKVATNWVTFASQFRAIEDYPEICGGAE